MRKHFINSICVTFLATAGVMAQEKDTDKEQKKDTVLGTQTVHIVQAYNPSVSDAFKIKESPSLDDSVTLAKKKIDYTIFSVPVASTFTPATGKASAIEKAPPEKLYNTYASLGVGNYTTVLADFFTSRALSRNETLDLGLRHHSSQGGIKDVDLDNKFFDTKLDAAYFKRTKEMTWGGNFGLQHQIYNWYGLPEDMFTDEVIGAIDEKQSYLNLELGGHLSLNEGYVKGGNLLLRRFSDGFSSGETRFVVKPSFEFPISNRLITTNVFVDYLSGKFDKNYYTEEELKYSNFQFGINPSTTIVKDDISLSIGATLAYMMDSENSKNKFYVYPNVKASYRILEEFVTAYAGVEGKLIQNSYHDFVADNHFVSPSLLITPSSQTYDAYVGIRGKFLPKVSYDAKISYSSVDDYAFYQSNPVMQGTALETTEGYQYGNSFAVIYDRLNTINVYGELNYTVSNNFNIGLNAEFNGYSTEFLEEAYNLPSIKGMLFSDFKIGKKWYGGVSVFFMGERKDLMSIFNTDLMEYTSRETITLDGYFDANLNVGYNFTDRLAGFVKLNNIANNDYQRWANYKVQGFQAVLGATYKFDF